MTFKVGDPRPQNAGRRAGTPNKRTQAVVSVIEAAAYQVGGVERLVEWIKQSNENETAFWCSMYAKLLPMHLRGSGEFGELELNVKKLSPEELAHQLMERGLPTSLFFDIEPPVLDENVIASEDHSGDDVPPVGSNFRG